MGFKRKVQVGQEHEGPFRLVRDFGPFAKMCYVAIWSFSRRVLWQDLSFKKNNSVSVGQRNYRGARMELSKC